MNSNSEITRYPRAVLRLLLVAGVILTALITAPRRRGSVRAFWLQCLCRRVLRMAGVRVVIEGAIPTSGLLISNHLGYLDILVLSAVAAPVFVSKHEVADWPLFGPAAIAGGTIFVDRSRRSAVAEVGERMKAALAEQIPIVLFAEGTTTGGDRLLPFKPSLFAPALALGCPITACALQYELPGGSVSDEVCYWGDHELLPHLLNLLSRFGLVATLRFGTPKARTSDRKAASEEVHAEVSQLLRKS